MKKKTFLQKKYYADYYKIISLNPKNISAVVKTIDKAFGDYIKIEIDAEKWKDCDISALKRRLKDISGVIIKNIVSGRNIYILNFLEAEDDLALCPFFAKMITNDCRGNFILSPLWVNYRSKGVVIGKIGGNMSFYSSCVYKPESEQCIGCKTKNFKKMRALWNMEAVAVFDSAIKVLYKSIKVLSLKESRFKHYLEELSLISESKSEFLSGLKFR